MAKLQYKSYDDINADPDKLLEFARTLKAEFEATPGSHVMGFQSFAQQNVSLGGQPLSMSRQMVHLEMKDQYLEDVTPGDRWSQG